MSVDFNGKGCCEEFREGGICPKCGHKGIYYIGSEILNGDPFKQGVDMEIEHWYRCADTRCKHEWPIVSEV